MVYYEKEDEFLRDASRGTFEVNLCVCACVRVKGRDIMFLFLFFFQHRHKAIRLDGVYLTKPEKKPQGAKFCFILHCPDKLNERQ